MHKDDLTVKKSLDYHVLAFKKKFSNINVKRKTYTSLLIGTKTNLMNLISISSINVGLYVSTPKPDDNVTRYD